MILRVGEAIAGAVDALLPFVPSAVERRVANGGGASSASWKLAVTWNA